MNAKQSECAVMVLILVEPPVKRHTFIHPCEKPISPAVRQGHESSKVLLAISLIAYIPLQSTGKTLADTSTEVRTSLRPTTTQCLCIHQA